MNEHQQQSRDARAEKAQSERTAPLAGKVAFVTGGSKGIGRAIAIGLAEAGAKVALTGREGGKGPGTVGEAAAQIRAVGGEALALICNVRDEKQVEASINACAEQFCRLDILVNNAGPMHTGATIETMPIDLWDDNIESHIRGSFLCTHFALRHFTEEGGSIINISSTAGDVTNRSAGAVSYAVSKAGMEQMTRGLALELRERNIAVNAIRPMSLLSEGALSNKRYVDNPDLLKKFSQPNAINPAIIFLAQCRSEFTGNIVNRTDFVDGGFPQMIVPSPFG